MLIENRMLKMMILFIIILLSSCSDKNKSGIKGEIITKDNLVEISQKMKNENSITIEDLDLYTKGLSRYGSNFDSLVGKTVSQVIESERDFIKNYQINTLLAQSNNLEIHMNLYFKYIGVQKEDTDTMKMNILHFEIKNKSNQVINKIEGELEFFDNQNQIVKRFPILVELELTPGNEQRFTQVYKHIPENPRDTTIRSPFVQLTALWKPSLLEFKNGKKLVVNYEKKQQ